MRIKILRLVIVGLFLLIVADLVYVQIIKGRYYFDLSVNNRIRLIPLEGYRGRIYDRNGKVLAQTTTSYDIYATPQDIDDLDAVVEFLSLHLNRDTQKIKDFYLRQKSTPFTPVIIAKDITHKQAIVIEENTYLYPGLYVKENYRREYPLKRNSSHILGYVGKINREYVTKARDYGLTPQSVVGYSGIEKYYDEYLKGENGGVQIEVNSRGKQVRLLSLREPSKGKDIALTIDAELQRDASEILSGKQGVVIVMDADNGEVLTFTSAPSYDPNIFMEKKLYRRAAKTLSSPASPLLNRGIGGAYPPGSVFKVLLALEGIANKSITANTTFICDGYYELGGIRFGCTHKHHSQNLIEALAHSCNIYFYELGRILKPEGIERIAQKLGLGEKTHIDLPFEKKGHIPTPRKRFIKKRKRWFAGDTLNMSIGQGDVLTTPMQLVKMMSIIVNDGAVVQPHLVKSIDDNPIIHLKEKSGLDIDGKVFQKVKEGLLKTVSDQTGTAHLLKTKDLVVGGKTGTAQSSGNKDHHAWFVGFAKSDVSNLVFCVFIEHGGSSQNANVIGRQLLKRLKDKNYL